VEDITWEGQKGAERAGGYYRYLGPGRRETTLFYSRFVILVALVETPIPMFNA
jgi:hypothetical protein